MRHGAMDAVGRAHAGDETECSLNAGKKDEAKGFDLSYFDFCVFLELLHELSGGSAHTCVTDCGGLNSPNKYLLALYLRSIIISFMFFPNLALCISIIIFYHNFS